jgi:hypothetical protein
MEPDVTTRMTNVVSPSSSTVFVDVSRKPSPSAGPPQPAPATRRTQRWIDALPILAYLIAAIALAGKYLYDIDPDSTSYITIARKYAAGDFAHAINAYWSPLYSWLLAVFVKCHVDPLVAAKIIGIAAGAGTIWTAGLICRRLALSDTTRRVVCWAIVPSMVFFALYRVTPDMTVTFLFALFLAHILHIDHRTNPGGVMTGVIIAAAYFAKAYALPFLVTTVTIGCAWLLINTADRATRARLARNFAVTLVTIALLIAPWAAALTLKYHRPMLGSVAPQAFRLNAPNVRMVWPLHTGGFRGPGNDTAISPWEDPTLIELPHWNPLASRRDLRYYVHVVRTNLLEVIGYLHEFTLLAPLVIGASLVVLARRRRSPGWRDGAVITSATPWLLLTLAVLCAGYLPLVYQRRYLSLGPVILAVLGGCLVEMAFGRNDRRVRRGVVLALLVLSFALWPVMRIVHDADHPDGSGRAGYRDAVALGGILPRGASIAAESDHSYHRALYAAYHLNARFFGVPRSGAGADETLRDLRRAGVQYFLVWGDEPLRRFPFLAQMRNLADGRLTEPKVFAISQPAGTEMAETASSLSAPDAPATSSPQSSPAAAPAH